MPSIASHIQDCLSNERDAHRRQVELVRASLVVRPPARGPRALGGRRP